MPRDAMPEGAITCLFTDIQDSTPLSRDLPPLEWQRIAAEHDLRVTACIRAEGGEPERSEGDSFFATFASSSAALRCAIAIQQAFPTTGDAALKVGPESGARAVQVRVGVYRPDRDVFRTEQGVFRDHEVNLAARLMGCAVGGQILASEGAYEAGQHYIATEWKAWDNRWVRDFDGPVTLWELLWDGTSRQIKAPLWAPEWLLREVNQFIGREAYLGQMVGWLKGDRPLLLLHGQGGIGKTRLVSQAVRQPEVGRHFEGRIYGVALDRVIGLEPATATVRRVAGLIAEAVGAHEELLKDLADETVTADYAAVSNGLIAYLKWRFDRQACLLVLDNFESVFNDDIKALVGRLLREVRTLRCLVTCRVHFNLGALSQAVPVEGLRVPERAEEDFALCDGFLLFRERALQNAPDLDLADREALVRILQATEGSALGIELVAARADTPFLTLRQMAADLEQSRLSVQAPDPDAYVDRVDVERHTSLEACFDWSYRLLPEEERRLYPCLSVFPSDFAPEAAQAVAEIPLALLKHWTLWNLLKQTEDRGRAFLPPALKEFATRRLPSEEEAGLKRRFIDYYSDLAALNKNMNDAAQRLTLCVERNNLHAAASSLCASQFDTANGASRLFDLGLALGNIPLGLRSLNLRQAIICYEVALQVYTEVAFPREWAQTQNNLGNAYSDLPTGERGENLRRAISYFAAALRVHTEAAFPKEWAQTQNNLGTAYGNLPTGNRGENLGRAISCFEAALQIRTEVAVPWDWARTQNNLGNAYASLPNGDRDANLRQAIACYEAALQIHTEVAFPQDWATAQNNLGNAYLYLPSGNREENLQHAIGCFEVGLRVRTESAFPHEWAMMQNNLGSAYANLPTGDRKENLWRAIGCYEAALRVRTETTFPDEWAQTQTNLGNAYSDLPSGAHEDNVRRAIAFYKAALRVRTEADFPQQWATTQFNLALTLAEAGRVEEARQAMQKAAVGYRRVGMEQKVQEVEKWLRQA